MKGKKQQQQKDVNTEEVEMEEVDMEGEKELQMTVEMLTILPSVASCSHTVKKGNKLITKVLTWY